MNKKYTFINDPGHGWLSVPLADLVELGIQDDITQYSYMSPTRAYLEEDLDAGTFLDAAKAKGWSVTIRQSYNDNSWKGRNWPSYSPYFVIHPLANGSTVSIKGKNYTYDGKRFLRDGVPVYRAYASNALTGIAPPV